MPDLVTIIIATAVIITQLSIHFRFRNHPTKEEVFNDIYRETISRNEIERMIDSNVWGMGIFCNAEAKAMTKSQISNLVTEKLIGFREEIIVCIDSKAKDLDDKLVLAQACETCGCLIAPEKEIRGESVIEQTMDGEKVRKVFYCRPHRPKEKR